MSKYSVKPLAGFSKEAKVLNKRYPSFISDLKELVHILEGDYQPQGAINLGASIYKIRMAISSKGKGKSGGARVCYYFKSKDNTIYLLSIFDKSEMENISIDILKKLVQEEIKVENILESSGAGRSVEYKITAFGRLVSNVDAKAYCSVETDKRYGQSKFNFDLFESIK
jgi:hypothetical protein